MPKDEFDTPLEIPVQVAESYSVTMAPVEVSSEVEAGGTEEREMASQPPSKKPELGGS